jgi:predicted O-linked N-acetylglucosamine transferase (SPINDLY family)
MDAVLIASDQAPAGAEDFFTEPLIRLSRCQFCWSPPAQAPEPALRRASEPPVFGSFNNTAKLNDQVLALWAALMRRVPNARLILKWKTFNDPMLRDRVRRYMTAAGVDAERIELRGASAHLDMLREYGDLDVALDPFPFSGALTTCEALWMGVPVVTLAGQRPVSRQSLSILRAIGLEDCCADTPDRYLDIAASLAVDQGRLRHLRHGLRARIKASPLRDGVSLARALERCFEALDAERRRRGQQAAV